MIQMKRILVPTDFSRYSEAALKYGVEFARKFGAELHVLAVVDDSRLINSAHEHFPMDVKELIELEKKQSREEMDKLFQAWGVSDVRIVPEVVQGVTFLEIVRYAKRSTIDLIIMGTHGRSGLAHAIMGSTAENVVRHAPCPLLTVRHPEHEFIHP